MTTHTLRAVIGAPPSVVFAALTERAALEAWLAEHAEVRLADGVFGFWGRFTPDGERDRQRLLALEPDSRLSFSWMFQGTLTRVDIELETAGSGTALTLRHADVPERPDGVAAATDFWLLSLANLANYAEGRSLAPKCDFMAFRPGEIRASAEIGAPASEVFASLTEPDRLNRWIAEKAEVEPEVGGRIDFGWGAGPVKIVELEPDKALAYTWFYDNEPETVVRWELDGSGGRTYLTIVHSGFGDRRTDDYHLGWQAFLGTLKRMLEVGESWQRIEVLTL
jgi:uncharacterized protein YndB with AHSA1/START domain